MTKHTKTQKQNFQAFRRAVLKWAKRYGLSNWDVDIARSPLPSTEHMESCSISAEDRYALFNFNTTSRDDLWTDESIDDTAQHEVLEVVLSVFYQLIRANDEDTAAAKHDVINRIVNLQKKGR